MLLLSLSETLPARFFLQSSSSHVEVVLRFVYGGRILTGNVSWEKRPRRRDFSHLLRRFSEETRKSRGEPIRDQTAIHVDEGGSTRSA